MARNNWRESAENEAASAVFHLMQQLIDQYRDNRPVMPLVVAQAEDPDAAPEIDHRVEQIVHQVHRANLGRRVPVKLVQGRGDSPYEAALSTVRVLSERPWETRGSSQYKPFAFPRSRLLAAIEQATAAVVAEPDRPTALGRDERILEELSDLRWRASRSGRDNAWDSLRAAVRPETFLGAVFIAVLSVLLGEIGWLLTVLVAAAAVAGLTVVRLLTRAAPPLLWLRPASRWLATTSSLAASSTEYPSDGWSVLSPGRSWQVIRARAAAVAERVADAGTGDQHARQFHLELRVQALLEDLLDSYRPHALDWRRSKRTVPPVVFLPRATEANGGMLLINAINNVRSRRSEVDPLLLLASLPAGAVMRHTPPLPPDPPANAASRSGARARYETWVDALSVGQAPAAAVALAWVLWLPLSTGQLTHEHAHAQLVTHQVRRTWTWWVMSGRTVAVLLVCALLGTFLWSERWKETYCHGPLTGRSTDSVRLAGPGGAVECIGVATVPAVRFAEGNTLQLNGAGKGVTFERIEKAIREQNAGIGAGTPHVTIVYAGPLSGTDANREDTRKGLEELTGVYLHQRFVNDTANRSVKLRVLTANGGQDMLRQTTAVRKIVEVARRDPSVVGVVGLGRNTTESAEATEILQRAGLPLVDTTNSGSDLAREFPNYFGLAATDEEQADALGLVAGALAGRLKAPQAVVLSRKVGNEDKDRYTTEQRRVGLEMLRRSGFEVVADTRYSLSEDGGSANLDGPLHTICGRGRVPDAFYFAGRVEDVNTLMSGLGQSAGCSDKAITVFTGDDLTKARFDDSTKLADRVTLYYGALAPMSQGGGRGFYEDSRKSLQALLPEGTQLPALPKERPYEDKMFASGQTVMSYQATAALYAAATRGDTQQSAAETWATLYSVALHSMPTGTITFRGTIPYADQRVHGLNIVEVTRPGPDARTRVVCGRAAGDRTPLTAADCRVP
ncbi:ABC transporter substrate-binding protein [Streptomyces sp. NPDC048305]|uniref:ABC transporter substrate-binding protein n=1 Tax=Streptomyces sp. NPDC048305 TaxID=3365532 RepID=UPI0037192378